MKEMGEYDCSDNTNTASCHFLLHPPPETAAWIMQTLLSLQNDNRCRLRYRYPLLLSRIRKATPRRNADREKLMQAQRKIEDQLNRINAVSDSPIDKADHSMDQSTINQWIIESINQYSQSIKQ